MNPKFIMMIGLVASGKSKYAKQLSISCNAVIHSSDELRKELLGDINDQSQNELVFTELNKRIKNDLKQGKSVIMDCCNINYKKRMEFLKQLKDIPCEKICYLIATPYEECLEYNRNRERQVPEYVIERMYKNIYIPQYYEGWNNIEIIVNAKKEYKFVTLMQELNKIQQENPFHSLSIGEHCSSTYSNLFRVIRTNKNESINNLISDLLYDSHILPMAALYHDIGKKFCKEFNKEKGYYTYYQHHLIGAYDALFYLSIYPTSELLEICNLIQWHMRLFDLKSKESIQKFIDLVGDRIYNELCLLHEADKLAK